MQSRCIWHALFRKIFPELTRSQKTLKMNVTRPHDRFFIFYRSKKSVFKKKLDVFEHRANCMILRSVFSNEKSTAMVTQGCSSISFPIENRYLNLVTISTKIRLLCVQRSLLFFEDGFFRSVKNKKSVMRASYIHFYGLLRSEQLRKQFF